VTSATFSAQADRLTLELTADRKRMYSPLVVALRNVSNSPRYTWRHLTVAEELVIQPRENAEAYRVQLNKDQWVFYRSLTPCIRRTVMGLHLNTEFYAARFLADDGTYEPLIEVSPE
jgi:hypothetical protein